ncbi:MAG TPA: ATP-dependent DNA helicase RecG [Candidatus Dormibacteraeota bacterium]|nr:ATP-dependent DNA helicase RecG [Candidatus Dormibacteraeota bacterium]
MAVTATPELTRPVAPETRLTVIPGFGPARADALRRLGLGTVGDLLLHLPRRYEDTSDVRPLRELRQAAETQTVVGRVTAISVRRSPRKGLTLIEATIESEGSVARAIWFGKGQLYITRSLHRGDEVVLSGKARWDGHHIQLQNPAFEQVRAAEQQHVGRISPVYPETAGLSSKFLRARIVPLLPVARALPDPVPPQVAAAEGLLSLGEALLQIHQPDSLTGRDRGFERIAFGEHFLLQLAATRARRRRASGSSAVIPYDVEAARAFAASFPFVLTNDQRRSAHAVLTDMAAAGAMNRLLQGDVGSGKTAVAAMAALVASRAGFQTVVMAPTEILARQQYTTLHELLGPHDVSVRLLVGSTPARARREVLAGIAGGVDSVVVGTHALIEEDVEPANLGLVVVDEQHRFGVVQRQRLRRKAAVAPNYLAMTATPIPRSLALTVYGDVDVSAIRELPPGRRPVETRVVPPHARDEAYELVRARLREGRQAFVICPLVEGSEVVTARSAVEEHERLRREVFPDPWIVELLHGRMPAREKAMRMGRFARGEAHLLVSTSVVEVGVDVPNAAVMIVEGAERFGLAQLHQFRGRVGRGAHASTCLLFQGSVDDDGFGRLDAIARTQSGFDIAELDLRTRGEGDAAGLRQHGLPEASAATLLDLVLLDRARAAAERWLDADPDLDRHPPLAAAMNGYRAVFDLD